MCCGASASCAWGRKAAISSCEKSLEWEWALHLLLELRNRGLVADVVTKSVAVPATGQSQAWGQSLDLLRELLAHGMARDLVAFNAIISACEASYDLSWHG